MRYYSILHDYIAHTILYFVKADSEEEALEKFAMEEIGAVKKDNNIWYSKDESDSSKDKYYENVYDLVKGEMVIRKEDRFEIIEIDFDSEADVQEIFCSREKIIKWSLKRTIKVWHFLTIASEQPKWLYKIFSIIRKK